MSPDGTNPAFSRAIPEGTVIIDLLHRWSIFGSLWESRNGLILEAFWGPFWSQFWNAKLTSRRAPKGSSPSNAGAFASDSISDENSTDRTRTQKLGLELQA